MKNSPNAAPAPPESTQGFNSLARFWACFIFCLVALGIVSALMLAGLFLLMGYRVF